jgi:NADPH-dependent 2,4-dienoyl-CoA reductase/sulfur reductase-like enzyme
MENNARGIYAAGDVAVTKIHTGELITKAIWPSASLQGAVSARDMAGGTADIC